MSQPPQRAPTSLLLILLTLLTGVALGWLVRDVVFSMTDDRQPTPDAPSIARMATAWPTANLPHEPTSSVPTVLPPTALPLTATPTVAPTLAPTLAPTVAPQLTPAPTAAAVHITSYIGHTVAESETLASIAAASGSTPELIARYNLLAGPPQPGRALIIPQMSTALASLNDKPLLVQRGRVDKPWVALTLDAGAGSAPVAQMLDTLRARNIKLTFFLTGKWIQENPDLTRRIVADGHEIANHTFHHPDLTRASSAAMQKELADTETLFQQTVGVTATIRPFFRPPYGAYNEAVLLTAEHAGYLPIYWTFDSLDSIGETKTPEFLLNRITGALTPDQMRGAIILAHCGSQPTADALPQVLDRFKAMGFEVKKLSDVLGD